MMYEYAAIYQTTRWDISEDSIIHTDSCRNPEMLTKVAENLHAMRDIPEIQRH
jgi:hypothetical protein